MLVNERRTPTHELRDADAIFQPQIEVRSVTSEAVFVERPSSYSSGADEDMRSYRLLYRYAKEFGIGHGCSVEWDIDASNTSRASAVRTTFAPRFALNLAESNPAIDFRGLELQFLSSAPRRQVLGQLEELCKGYDSWIASKHVEMEKISRELDPEQQRTGTEHLDACGGALDRMRGGISRLKEDDAIWKAFVLANRAMLQNRARSDWLKAGKVTPRPDETGSHSWRPFQLAFILLCIAGIAEPTRRDRDVADLLWFPTGGGKTEAYLGIIAFTVFLRRLRNGASGGGVTALMRYTLRLLTVQQFERAALLICCCENLRLSERDLGREPISLGLWVGEGATPNTLAAAREALNRLQQGQTPRSGNPVQLQACPWCGTRLDRRNYWIATDTRRLMISCRNETCEFRRWLPVYVVDEDVYNFRPTLLIATVDKFAGLPWLEKAAALFNLSETTRSEQLPPELIIQDELHLISGPLGTLVGLYETALDTACSRLGVRPKIIASTATIRRASEQGRALFNRQVLQFPPPGLDARDSYFAVEATAISKGNRLYIGLMAPGTSHTTLLVRTYAALLQYTADIAGSDEVKDPYWTLVGYFNSLRVLGGARMQVQDDVEDRMEQLSRRSGLQKRAVEQKIELTSREPSGDIPAHLRHMAVSRPSSSTLDVILATNMISVGVDIDRLGLMVVMGQPQATSEYIQATSRVGRLRPGLVVTLFNSARSRDRSHYESFVAYHSALYRQVESTSVTPYSARARDRGLHAILISIARLLVSGFRLNRGASNAPTHKTDLQQMSQIIVDRVRNVDPDEAEATAAELSELVDDWIAASSAAQGGLGYMRGPATPHALLVSAGRELGEDSAALPTLWSLRDVDLESNLYLI